MLQTARNSIKLKDASVVDVIKIMDRGFLMLGIKGDRLPEQPEKMLMWQELTGRYVNMGLSELDLAFTLAARGELDFNAQTFQNFSIMYMHTMISAYMRWASRHHTNEIIETKQTTMAQIEDRLTDDDVIKIAFDSYKKLKDWRSIMFGLRAFQILYNQNKIVFDANDVYHDTLNALTNHLFSLPSYQRNDFRKQMKSDDFMENECRKRALAKYFDTIEKMS